MLFYVVIEFLFLSQMVAQTIVIGTPSLGFTQACASSSFNTYSVTFTVFPVSNIQSGNQFIIELSDANGVFNSPTVLTSLSANSSPVNTTFSLPTSAKGENYRIRIRSTAPAVTSPSSVSFAAYYAIHNQPFSINNNQASVTICEGGSTTLQVVNTGTAASPLFYSNLTYKWYRNFAEIPNATSSSLTVSQAGNYYCIVDYGSCIMNSYSNIVTVNTITGQAVTISPTTNSFICNNTANVLTSSIQNSSYSYQWFKNNVAINGANSSSYSAIQQGTYQLKVTSGSCVFESNLVYLEAVTLEGSLNISNNEVLLPGNTISVAVTTNAEAPTFKWKKDGVLISGATTANYTVSQPGNYIVEVTENQGCIFTKSIPFSILVPSSFTATIQPQADFASCSSTDVTLSLATITAVTNNGNQTFTPSAGTTFLWRRNGINITNATQNSITINNASFNGNYSLQIQMTGYPVIVSNTVAINVKVPTPSIQTNGVLCGTNSVTLTSSVTGQNYNYKWYKNNVVISSATLVSYTTSEPGNYKVEVTSGTCSSTSSEVNLQENQINVSLAANNNIIIPNENKILSVTTNAINPSYVWYRNNSLLSGESGNTLIANQAGIYKVEVTQNNSCLVTQEASFTLISPSSFSLIIQRNTDYEDCISEQAHLTITSFIAQTNQGNQSIETNQNFTYNWYKNGVLINSSTTNEHYVTSHQDNGVYQLKIEITGFGFITSNDLQIQLGVAADFEIEIESGLCDNQNPAILNFATQLPYTGYTFEWRKHGLDEILGTNSSLSTTEEGIYYLLISYNGCVYSTEKVELNQNSLNQVNINIPLLYELVEGSITTVTATGGNAYEWFFEGVAISTSTSIEISEEGNYSLIANAGGCEKIIDFEVIKVPNTFKNIPNILTINGDGINDFWSLPIEYVNKETVEVVIYSSEGKVVYRKRNYQNNWAPDASAVSKKEPVFYYTISLEEEIIKKGSITVID